MAEGVGFEPTAQGLPMHGISSAAPSAARSPLLDQGPRVENLAEGRGFEPPRDLLGPYPISSRTPSTGLGHPSANLFSDLSDASLSHSIHRRQNSKFSRSCPARLPCHLSGRRTDLLDGRGQVVWCQVGVTLHHTSVRHPPSSWTVRKSTPATTRREANLCRRECQVTPSRRAASPPDPQRGAHSGQPGRPGRFHD